jgi:hypothetical protein
MLTDNFGQIIEVEKRITFCPKAQATWKDFQKSSRLAKSLRQFEKKPEKLFPRCQKILGRLGKFSQVAQKIR